MLLFWAASRLTLTVQSTDTSLALQALLRHPCMLSGILRPIYERAPYLLLEVSIAEKRSGLDIESAIPVATHDAISANTELALPLSIPASML